MKMRTEQEMFDLILNYAKADERVRAVVMNGSRAVEGTRRDCFQDYDIGFIVKEVKSFACDKEWIKYFGELMILQLPTDWHSHPYDYDSNKPFVYLMQFMDGTRIDLCITSIEDFEDDGEPMVALLDKEGILSRLPGTSAECYFVKAPSEKEFFDCCNEFWWLCPYVAKELWRQGLPYAKLVEEEYIRRQFMKMLNWYVGLQHNYKVQTGKMGKNLREFLSAEDWVTFIDTYPTLNEEHMWQSLFVMSDMFREKAKLVAKHFGYQYPDRDDLRVTQYLKHVSKLSKSAKTIY